MPHLNSLYGRNPLAAHDIRSGIAPIVANGSDVSSPLEGTGLLALVNEFTSAVRTCSPVRAIFPGICFFPRHSVAEVCLLLAKYLEHKGYGRFYLVCGVRDSAPHVWLLQGSTIIDITDEYEDELSTPVIVTVNHTGYSRFRGDIQGIADIEYSEAAAREPAWRAYKLIVSEIEERRRSLLVALSTQTPP
jgi:hypothetical protein